MFAEGQAKVAAEQIAAEIRASSTDAYYGGNGICYLEFGHNQIALVDVTFFGDQKVGKLIGPVRGPRRRQGRVRLEPHQPLVRPRVVFRSRLAVAIVLAALVVAAPVSGGAPGPFQFSASRLSAGLRERMRHDSWRPGCPVSLDDLRLLRMSYTASTAGAARA